jgi:translation initiation factor IF-2
MAELKLPRLLAATKEFNIGQDTLVDFLAGKGFPKDDLKPTAKLSEDMYKALITQFGGDKAAKAKADQIEIPRGVAERKKKEEEEAAAALVTKAESKKEKPVVEKKTAKEEPVSPPIVQEVAKEIIEEIVVVAPSADQTIRIEAPEVEAPQVLGKIDLSKIESSTRPKKIDKTKETKDKKEVKPEEKPKAKKETKTEAKQKETPKVEEPQPDAIAPVEPTIENIRAERIEGPKILGKIDLPVDNDTRPKREDDKRKRKRIQVDKKGAGGNRQQADKDPLKRDAGNRPTIQTGGNRPGGPGGNRPGGGPGGNRGGAGGNRGGAGGNRGAGGGNRFGVSSPDRIINEKEIQEKLRETQAKLSGGTGRGKSLKAKYRKAKRDEAAEMRGNEGEQDTKLQVTEFISVSELASLMDVSFADVIGKCMGLGIMVSINQRLDAEVIELVSSEFGFDVEFIGMDEVDVLDDDAEEDDPADLKNRAPIVTIMGHVDHGKTSLLDYIRNANVVSGEAGGITQHIGAYEVTSSSGKHLTFLDTPGHEAFTAMRARGAKVTDIAVIVVAADDAVMPQTKEAISHAQAANVPMIFAFNKIDKDGANADTIRQQLSSMNILVEEWGGKFQSQELSAKKGTGVDALLEKILLEAEMLDLKANPDKEGNGTIIEASLDKGRGYVATVLVQSGTLRQGDLMVSGQYYGRIKAMFNERNQRVTEAPPSSPVVILGLNGAPQAGEKFKVFEDESDAKEIANKRAQILREQGLRARKHITIEEIGRRLALGNFKELNIIIKGDFDGSVEALSDSLQKLSTEEIAVRVVLKGVGQISESDVLLAAASDAILIGFNVRPSMQANKLAENEGVQIKTYSIIYNAIEEIKSAMEGMLEPKFQEKIVANVEIREVYKFDKATVAGCYVLDGKIARNSKIRIIRDGIVVYPSGGGGGELGSLKRFKDDAKDVATGFECGLTIKNYTDMKVGDVIEAYEEEEVKRTL